MFVVDSNPQKLSRCPISTCFPHEGVGTSTLRVVTIMDSTASSHAIRCVRVIVKPDTLRSSTQQIMACFLESRNSGVERASVCVCVCVCVLGGKSIQIFLK